MADEKKILTLQEADIQVLESMKDTLESDFMEFYTILNTIALSIGYNAGEAIEHAVRRIRMVSQRLESTIDPTKTFSVKDREDLTTEMGYIKEQLEELAPFIPTGIASHGVEEVLEQKRLTVSRLISVASIFAGKIPRLGKPKRLFTGFASKHLILSSTAEVFGGAAADIGRGLVRSLPLGSLALQGLDLISNKVRQKRASAQAEENRAFSYTKRGSVGGGEKAADSLNPLKEFEEDAPEGEGGGGSRRGAESGGLLNFFKTGWKSATWTRDIHDKLMSQEDGVGGEKKKDGGSFLSKIAEKIGGIAPAILKVLSNPLTWAVLGAVIGGIFLKKMLKEDSEKGIERAKKEGWFGEPGKELTDSQKRTASIGSMLGGAGPGLLEKGAAKDKIDNIKRGMVKGGIAGGILGAIGLAGVAMTAPVSAPAIGLTLLAAGALGAGQGALSHAIGGKALAQVGNKIGKFFSRKSSSNVDSMGIEGGGADALSGQSSDIEKVPLDQPDVQYEMLHKLGDLHKAFVDAESSKESGNGSMTIGGLSGDEDTWYTNPITSSMNQGFLSLR